MPIRIPDDVFATRCPYCKHRQPGIENIDIPEGALWRVPWRTKLPCGILGICQCNDVPGECLSFTPNPMFGICMYCEHNNSFHDGFCTVPGGATNKRRVFLGWRAGGGRPDYWGDHALFTCDRYRVNACWKDLIMRETLAGRAPENFDPETWKPLEKIEGTAAAEQWAKLQAEAYAKAAAEAKALEDREAGKKQNDAEQITLFDTED